jgi:hypothetical protein
MSTLQIDDREWNLSRAEFADAIAKGLGRALLYVQNYGLDRVKDLVLNACLHDLSYDIQCSNSRSKWLFAMFANSPHYLEFRDEILTELLKEPESDNDLHQICGIVKEMALTGDLLASEKLTERVYYYSSQPNSEDWVGANELIEIQGIDTALELSRIFGRRLLVNSDDSVPDDLDLNFFENMSEESIEIFDRYAKLEESIATYYKYIVDGKLNREREDERECAETLQPKKTISLAKIIDLARHKKHDYPYIYMRFGQKNATPAELETVFSLLLNEPDEEICLRLLWVFRRAPMPRLAERLFEWVDSQTDLLKIAALQAFAQISDDRIYQLGRSKLAKGQITGVDTDTLDLFINNYHAGDAALILAKLKAVEIDPEDLHDIGFSIFYISEKQVNPELVILLEWIYDRTPCCICRDCTIGQLKIYQPLPDRILAEYQFDSRKWDK